MKLDTSKEALVRAFREYPALRRAIVNTDDPATLAEWADLWETIYTNERSLCYKEGIPVPDHVRRDR